MTINLEAKNKIIKARIAMIMKQPFFGVLALRLKMIEDKNLKIKTMSTDGKSIKYDPDFVMRCSHEELMFIVAHEVGHNVFQHIGRRNGRDPKRWNFAGDYVINAVLKDSGFTMPEMGLYSPAFAGMSTDQVYQALPPDPPGNQMDEIMDALADGQTLEMDADEWEVAAVQAAEAAKSQGNLPASLKRFIDEIVQGKADWRAVMRRFMTETSKEDYSYARVNRKFASLGIYLPGLYSESMGEICAVIDTSGSITDEILKAFGAEISEIKNQMRPSMTRVIYCDADVNHVDEFEQYDELKFEGHGGGGTDFRPPFKHLQERDIEPKCFVYLTDGYGPFPTEPPPYPVLWLMTTDVIPPWGEVVRIEL